MDFFSKWQASNIKVNSTVLTVEISFKLRMSMHVPILSFIVELASNYSHANLTERILSHHMGTTIYLTMGTMAIPITYKPLVKADAFIGV